MKSNRPVNLDLTSLKFPPMAIVSILHRISGVLLFILFPILLCAFGVSLQSETDFQSIKNQLSGLPGKLLLWAFSVALIFHLLAGIRHILMDMGFGEGLQAGRRSAMLVIACAVVLMIFLGLWIW